jgi:hypothetical protein
MWILDLILLVIWFIIIWGLLFSKWKVVCYVNNPNDNYISYSETNIYVLNFHNYFRASKEYQRLKKGGTFLDATNQQVKPSKVQVIMSFEEVTFTNDELLTEEEYINAFKKR